MRRLLTSILLFTGLLQGLSAREDIRLTTEEGTVAMLPAAVWNGKEWKQVKWSNSARHTEEEEAALKAGSEYDVEGIVLGSDKTVTAHITVTGKTDKPLTPTIKARPLPLCCVQLTGDNILTRNRDRDIELLLSLDVSQQMYNYHDTYGLPTEGMTVSDGWDSPTTKLKGHGTGHWLSALALAYASTADEAHKAQHEALLERMRTAVKTMRMCQERTFVWSDSLGRYFEARDLLPGESLQEAQGTWEAFNAYKKDYRHYGYGYINAIPAQHCALIEAFRPYNNENWVWAPYYTVHKQLAGLCDIAEYVDDKEVAATALSVARDMGLWVWNRLHYRTTAEQHAKMWNMYIAGEVGGMQEVLARLASLVPAEKQRFTEAAAYFDAPVFYEPLSKGIDDIRTRHANQHIPMITGALRLYGENGQAYYYNIASNFWDLLQGRYTYAPGGVGNGEMFRQPYAQMVSMLPNPNINETCCAYNLMKLSRDLACYRPDDARYMDYAERLLSNQIVGSLSPERWAVCYQYAVGTDAEKPFGNETPQATCCGGTGVENHVRYQECCYYTGGDTLWVNLYLPTLAVWKEKGMTVSMEGTWPMESASLSIRSEQPVTVKLRVPYWATKGFRVSINGKKLKGKAQPSSYIELPSRKWEEGDTVTVEMPFSEHLCYGPDPVDGEWLACHMRGPLAMVTQDGGNSFLPDNLYQGKGTHYLKAGAVKSKHKGGDVKRTALVDALALARERWEHGGQWAPHGLRRLTRQMRESENVLSNPSVTQEQIDAQVSTLSMILNGMRPSTLAEPEDVASLQERVKKLRAEETPGEALNEALEYAEMVIRYVIDGSGTHDLIHKAEERLLPFEHKR